MIYFDNSMSLGSLRRSDKSVRCLYDFVVRQSASIMCRLVNLYSADVTKNKGAERLASLLVFFHISVAVVSVLRAR